MKLQSLKPEICGKCVLIIDYSDIENPVLLTKSEDGQHVTVLCDEHANLKLDVPFLDSTIHNECKLLSFSRDSIAKTANISPESLEFSFDENRNIVFTLPDSVDKASIEQALQVDSKVVDAKVILEI